MNHYLKAVLSLMFMCISFLLMVQNKYICCLGSLLLPMVHLPHWSNGTTGLHMPILYFGIPFVYSFKLVHTHVRKAFDLKKRWVLLMAVLMISGLSVLSNQGLAAAKGHSEELLAIAYNPSTENLNYSTKNKVIETLKAQIILQNFSDEDLSFTMTLDNTYEQDANERPIEILDLNGTPYVFKLEAGVYKTFGLDNSRMQFTGGRLIENGTFSGRCEAVILTSTTGQKVRLVWNDFWGTAN